MPASGRIPAGRACFACAQVKRACDRTLPVCKRCIDRDVECVYPASRRLRPTTRISEPGGGGGGGGSLLSNENMHCSELMAEDWDAIGNMADMPSLPALPLPMPTIESAGLGSLSSLEAPCPWFLDADTWTIDHRCRETSDDPPRPEGFIEGVRDMLRDWVATGHNGFIHEQLYRKGFPRCLQDAYTSLSSYVHRTPAMKIAILEIAHERAMSLVRENLPDEGILGHLSRIQALFVYLYIQLFDGSVRHRALGERHIPTLKSWTLQMWSLMRETRDVQNPYGRIAPSSANGTDATRALETEMWRSWILAESARRTFVVVSFMTSLYLTQRDGWADCCGGVMLTARRGLWDAQSARSWFRLCCEKSPLLVPSLQPEEVQQHHPAREMDPFVATVWTLLLGPAQLNSWLE